MKMAKIGLPKGSGKLLNVREKSVKNQGILKWILSGNPDAKHGSKYFAHRRTFDPWVGVKRSNHIFF